MEERDYFKRQIDQLGKVLGKLIADLLGNKSNGFSDGFELTNQILQNELNFDVAFLITIPNQNIITFLKTEKGLSNENIERLSEILLLVLGEITKVESIEKRIILLEYVQQNDKIFSIERNNKIQKLKNYISNL